MTTTENPTWRVPVQERSRRRFRSILEAAALELDATSYERLSLDAVAKRAGSSVGSVYRYFPDKTSLVGALLHSHTDRLSELFDAASTAADQPFEDVVLSVSERYERFILATPGLSTIAAASLVDRDARGMFRESMAPLETGLLESLTRRFPHLGRERLSTVATVVVRLTESLMTVAATAQGPSREAVLHEMRVLIRGYAAELAETDVG